MSKDTQKRVNFTPQQKNEFAKLIQEDCYAIKQCMMQELLTGMTRLIQWSETL